MQFRPHPPARDAGEVRRRHEANRRAWNETGAYHAARVQETIDFLRAGGSNLHPIERANLGRLADWCGTAIHLQCASGCDTLSLWNEGARRVVGVDISEVHIANARRTSEALGAPATWYRADVLDTPRELDGTADLVYTGRGAVSWIFDLETWAAVIARLLRPGGILHLLDDHPVPWLFDIDATTFVPSGLDYFTAGQVSRGWPESYIPDAALGVPAPEQSEKYDRTWAIADVFMTLRGSGLTVERLGEHREGYWDVMPNLAPELRGRIPLSYSIVARRP
jgi:SAM-dependent methyltransferase